MRGTSVSVGSILKREDHIRLIFHFKAPKCFSVKKVFLGFVITFARKSLGLSSKRETRNLVITYQCNKTVVLVPLARERIGWNGLKLENSWANVFQVLAFLFVDHQ